MDPMQIGFILNSLIIGVFIAIGYWIERGITGVYIGWLIGSLVGIWIPELIIAYSKVLV